MHQNQRMQIVGVVGEAAVGFLPVDSELEALLFCHCMILPLITGSSPGTFGHKKKSTVQLISFGELNCTSNLYLMDATTSSRLHGVVAAGAAARGGIFWNPDAVLKLVAIIGYATSEPSRTYCTCMVWGCFRCEGRLHTWLCGNPVYLGRGGMFFYLQYLAPGLLEHFIGSTEDRR